MNVGIRWMIRRDLPEVCEIEQKAFDFSWTEEEFIQCLRIRNCIGMVAYIQNRKIPSEEKIVGYMLYELFKNRLRLLNFAVDYDYRLNGVGRAMIQKLIDKLSSHRRSKIVLALRESNLDAQIFFRSMGFRASKILHNFYPQNGENAYVFKFQLQNSEVLECTPTK